MGMARFAYYFLLPREPVGIGMWRTTFFHNKQYYPIEYKSYWWKIAEARQKPGWYGLLMMVPIVNFVVMGMLAWGD